MGLGGGPCEMRFDSGHMLGNHLKNPGRNSVSCWSPEGGEGGRGGVLSGGGGGSICHSVDPSSPDARCLLRRDAGYPEVGRCRLTL